MKTRIIQQLFVALLIISMSGQIYAQDAITGTVKYSKVNPLRQPLFQEGS